MGNKISQRRVAADTTTRVGKDKRAAHKTQPDADLAWQQVSAALRDALMSVPESDRAGFVTSVLGSVESLDPSLWGPAPMNSERRVAGLENLRRDFESRRRLLDNCLTRAETAELLGISEQAVLDRLESGSVVGLKQGREWRLPAWQFHADAERGMVPGLAQLRRVFPGGLVSLSDWVTTPNVDLDGSTPLAELAAGRVDVVLLAAQGLTAAAW